MGKTKTSTYYRKSSGLLSAFKDNCDTMLFKFGDPWFLTEKIDGSQLWIEMELNDEGFTFQLRTHGGNECFKDSDEKMTIEDLTKHTYYYQKANLTRLLPPVLTAFSKLMKDMGLVHSHFYCEVTLPGKTPCRLDYPDEMKSRVWFFNHVYNDGTENVKINLTTENIERYKAYGIPTVPMLMSGQAFKIADFAKILNWCDIHPDREGAMFYQVGGPLLKIKTHHGQSIPPDVRPDFRYEMVGKLYDTYLECLSESQIIKAKRDRYAQRQKRQSDRLKDFLSDAQIETEIGKEFTHESQKELLESYSKAKDYIGKSMIIGQSDWRKAVVESLKEEHGEEKTTKSKKKISSLMMKYLEAELANSE